MPLRGVMHGVACEHHVSTLEVNVNTKIYHAGGLPQPGPIFQALPEPLPLPPLPQPERPAQAMSPGMAPETAPAGLPQPGTSFQACSSTTFQASLDLQPTICTQENTDYT